MTGAKDKLRPQDTKAAVLADNPALNEVIPSWAAHDAAAPKPITIGNKLEHYGMELILAQPRGFCAGVVRAIDIVELALEVYEPPVYVYHDIVHNHHVVAELKQKGAIFVDDIDAIPERAVAIFSAHGVSNAVVEQAESRLLNIIDATCPLVTKVHLQCRRFAARGYTVIIVGHLGHEEVEGTMGSFQGPVHVVSTIEEACALELPSDAKLGYVTQTTLSVDDTRGVIDALQRKFPQIEGPGLNDICYATQNRQNAIRELARSIDLLLVVGAANSSNSNRLREVGEQCGVPSYLIADEEAIREHWFREGMNIGISAGASAPESLVNRVIEKMQQLGYGKIHSLDGIIENTTFKMPQNLLDAARMLRTKKA
jgi:4-hydroxy-3-methylbut-2-enyl diphosphate reductase